MSELPLVSATERTVYQVLKELLLNAEKREAIGNASRAYALKWHSADTCAERYERIYDEVMSGAWPRSAEVQVPTAVRVGV
jgi:glycosyltransferase involved in cell wall biosynthesis